MKKNYFCGWYFKCQSETHTLALIPAFHMEGGRCSCSIQVITESGAWNIPFGIQDFHKKKGKLYVRIGENIFCEKGFKVNIHTEELDICGSVKFGPFKPLKYDIMGPFCCVPSMECRHSVYSMEHRVNGKIRMNGEEISFRKAHGYMEGDRGTSFPSSYVWTQCHFREGSLMLSVAEIPLGSMQFTGIIAVVFWKGKEYRFATYLGAKVVKMEDGEVCVSQGSSMLRAKLLEKEGRSLLAPSGGAMNRIIRENPSCRAFYSFEKDGQILFAFRTDKAAFEYEYC
ncbi:MAG: tocopherol cyclase family protein [Eubacteriales bacterium]|nr:tocopherol cyclase family protein [Eubacteriales bacterium]